MECSVLRMRVEEVVALCELDGECWERIGLVRVEGMDCMVEFLVKIAKLK